MAIFLVGTLRYNDDPITWTIDSVWVARPLAERACTLRNQYIAELELSVPIDASTDDRDDNETIAVVTYPNGRD